jgi:hypothetical protein
MRFVLGIEWRSCASLSPAWRIPRTRLQSQDSRWPAQDSLQTRLRSPCINPKEGEHGAPQRRMQRAAVNLRSITYTVIAPRNDTGERGAAAEQPRVRAGARPGWPLP